MLPSIWLVIRSLSSVLSGTKSHLFLCMDRSVRTALTGHQSRFRPFAAFTTSTVSPSAIWSDFELGIMIWRPKLVSSMCSRLIMASSDLRIPVANPSSIMVLSRMPLRPSGNIIFRIKSIVMGFFLSVLACSGLLSTSSRISPLINCFASGSFPGACSPWFRWVESIAQRMLLRVAFFWPRRAWSTR